MKPKFRVLTTNAGGEQDPQHFEHRIEAEEAAAALARDGFFSTLWEAIEEGPAWRYLCDFAPKVGARS